MQSVQLSDCATQIQKDRKARRGERERDEIEKKSKIRSEDQRMENKSNEKLVYLHVGTRHPLTTHSHTYHRTIRISPLSTL